MAFGFTLREFKAGFFDAAGVVKAVDEGHRRVQSKFGAFVQKRARTSMRRRKQVSRPGEPPSAHEGSLKRIFFAYDPATLSTVVGPVAFGRGDVPRLQEKGGRATRKGKPATYRPHPFMGPAGDAEAPKFQDLLRGMVN